MQPDPEAELAERLAQLEQLLVLVGRVDQHDGRVHRDAGERDHAVERVERERVVRDGQPVGHAGEGQRHGHQDHERLPIALELRRQDQVDQAQPQQEQHLHGGQALFDVFELAREVQIHPRVLHADGFPAGLDGVVGHLGVGDLLVQVGLDRDGAAQVVVADEAPPGLDLDLHQRAQPRGLAVG